MGEQVKEYNSEVDSSEDSGEDFSSEADVDEKTGKKWAFCNRCGKGQYGLFECEVCFRGNLCYLHIDGHSCTKFFLGRIMCRRCILNEKRMKKYQEKEKESEKDTDDEKKRFLKIVYDF